MIDVRDKFMFREIFQSPIKQFEEDQTTPNSFQYVGTEVTVGQAERIVCWYKLRNASQYRAVYGDLTVKDVSDADFANQNAPTLATGP